MHPSSVFLSLVHAASFPKRSYILLILGILLHFLSTKSNYLKDDIPSGFALHADSATCNAVRQPRRAHRYPENLYASFYNHVLLRVDLTLRTARVRIFRFLIGPRCDKFTDVLLNSYRHSNLKARPYARERISPLWILILTDSRLDTCDASISPWGKN